LACGLFLAVGASVQAQQVVTETTTTNGPQGTTQVRRISQLLGSNVHLQGANNYGKVEDVVLNDNGGVDYLVVNREGRYAMLPWSAANVNYGNRVVNYDVAPTAVQPLFFERNAWPNMAEEQYITHVRTAFPNLRPGAVAPVPGALPAPGAVVGPGGVVKEKVKVNERNGEVKIKEKVRP